LRLKHAAALATSAIIIIGFAMISPIFFRQNQVVTNQKVMLCFSIMEPKGSAEWCKSLSLILNKYDLAATVFITGKVAEQYPQTVTCFNERIDIGSQTFSGVNLASILDYSLKLQEIQKGKTAVENAGNLCTKVFRAPYGDADEDIYSLLCRSDITADFSYENQYNIYYIDKFIKIETKTYDSAQYPPEFFSSLSEVTVPIIITFEENCSVSSIDDFLSALEKTNLDFVNASDLAGCELTIRQEQNV